MKEFWNSDLTQKSWEVLCELKRKYSFIVIGGWAAYLVSKQQKSKDIDIVVDIKELQKFKKENLIKNDKLKKYEIKTGEIDIDIYSDYYSKLTIPPEDLKEFITIIDGFNVIIPEALLILKQGAEFDRGYSLKGQKDKLDIIAILLFCDINFKKYKEIINKYSLDNYIQRLMFILRNFNDYGVFNLSPREFKIKKQKLIEEIKKI